MTPEEYVADAQRRLHGRTIIKVDLAQDEYGDLWWQIHLDDGSVLTPSRDDAGNGPGAVFFFHPGAKDNWFGLPRML